MQFVKFCFLGAPSVEVDGVLTTHFRWSKLPAFFAYLVLFPGEQSRESMAEALWPDRAADSARQNLRQTLLYADKLLAPRADQVFQITRNSIALRASAVRSDIDSFIRLPSPTLDRNARMRCLQLIDSYAGPFLPQMSEGWVVDARAQIGRTYLEALVFAANELIASDPIRSLELAETAVREEPFDDSARSIKIGALKAMGRDAAAQQEFAAYAKLLKEQLGMQPGRAVTAALQEGKEPAAPSERAPEPVDSNAVAIVDALQFLRDQGMYKEAADLALALVPFWIGKGTPALGQEQLVTAFDNLQRPVGGFEKLSLAKLSLAEGDVVKTRELCEEIMKTSRPSEVQAETQLLLARLNLREVKPLDALRHALLSLRLLRKLGNRALEFEAWNCVAMARFSSNQFERVLYPTRSAERLGEFVHATAGWQSLRLYRAYALLRLGRREEAENEAWAVRRESDSLATPTSYRFKGTLGRILEDLGHPKEAKKVYEEAIEECRARGNEFSLSVALTYLGDLELELGNPDESLHHHFLALKSRRGLKQNLGIATSLRGIGRALLKKRHASEAKMSLLESVQRFRDDNALSGHASAQLLLAQAEFEAGDRLLARRLAQNSVELLRGLSPSMRLTVGPWGEHILEEGEALLRRIESKTQTV